ncbi:hypothetical protein KSD_45840 [Ktedonobacter sp. SOSP1-85]|uniref:hypothetical protein n=1 Tax=Ktedonobacter sp. SOSP1-85 TaxID=2778367 RepID=UPI00191509A8|nr:hypothetical protein [Ktedonobacter sp. SOSP1-85]GHO76813.1 hypothetical protein KSD_45840 [Ktedonobacter sp. SOSP1-85]
MKSHTLAPITRASSLTEQLGIHDLTEQELEQVAGAQGYGHDHDYGRNDHDHDWDDHRRGWGWHYYNRGWHYSRGWRR